MNGTLKLEFSIILARAVPDIRIRPDFDEKPDIRLSGLLKSGINFIKNRQINSFFVLLK